MIVGVLAELLPKLGVTIGSEQLTTTIQTLILLGSAAWILIRRFQAGGVSVAGIRQV